MDPEGIEEEGVAQMKGDISMYPLFGDRLITIRESKDKSALPYINNRFQYDLPIETIDVEDVLKVIQYIRVNPNRSCSPEEVHAIVEQIKKLLTDAVMKMEHHKRYLNKRGTDNDTEGT